MGEERVHVLVKLSIFSIEIPFVVHLGLFGLELMQAEVYTIPRARAAQREISAFVTCDVECIVCCKTLVSHSYTHRSGHICADTWFAPHITFGTQVCAIDGRFHLQVRLAEVAVQTNTPDLFWVLDRAYLHSLPTFYQQNLWPC